MLQLPHPSTLHLIVTLCSTIQQTLITLVYIDETSTWVYPPGSPEAKSIQAICSTQFLVLIYSSQETLLSFKEVTTVQDTFNLKVLVCSFAHLHLIEATVSLLKMNCNSVWEREHSHCKMNVGNIKMNGQLK